MNLAYLALISVLAVMLALAAKRRGAAERRFKEIQNREVHYVDVPADEASWDDAARAEAHRLFTRTQEWIRVAKSGWSWQYDHEVENRMWRKRDGKIEYRPATQEEIKAAAPDATMQQW